MKKPHKAKPKAGRKKAEPVAARGHAGARSGRHSKAVPPTTASRAPPSRATRSHKGAIAAVALHVPRLGLGSARDTARAFAGKLEAAQRVAHLAALNLRSGLGRLGAEARAAARTYSHDEREALVFLFLPFLLVASAIVVHQSVRNLERYLHAVAVETEVAPVRTAPAERQAYAGRPQSTALPATPERIALSPLAAPETHVRPSARAEEPLRPAAVARSATPLEPPLLAAPIGPMVLAPERLPRSTMPLSAPPDRLASLAPLDAANAPRHVAPDAIDAFDLGDDGKPVPRICLAEPRAHRAALLQADDARSLAPDAFGVRLAEAAQSQVGSFVVYTDNYRSISYPMGDVNPFFGVCTDVVIRAYRAVGLDLQALVHEARVGRGDTSIDHRRTETLRRFFARQGESLPVTSFAEDYRPGDIVTYDRPQNRHTRSHIAIVSNVMAPSGRPMIVHNRGWGPALEDALFVDEITGHYRYRGPKLAPAAPAAREASLTGAKTSASVVLPAAFAAPAN